MVENKGTSYSAALSIDKNLLCAECSTGEKAEINFVKVSDREGYRWRLRLGNQYQQWKVCPSINLVIANMNMCLKCLRPNFVDSAGNHRQWKWGGGSFP